MTQTASDEHALLTRVKGSDRDAFRTLFERYQPILFRSVVYRVKDADLAHDIVQETFIRVWHHRAKIKPSLPFPAYLFRISGNLLRDHAKWAAVRIRHAERLAGPERHTTEDPGDILDARILDEELTRIINTLLPGRVRTVFLLSRIEGKSNAEIAAMLGSSPKTIENQLGHALRIIRRRLSDL